MDPRSALKLVMEKAEKKGWTCMSGAEFEVSLGFLALRAGLGGDYERGEADESIVLPIQGDSGYNG